MSFQELPDAYKGFCELVENLDLPSEENFCKLKKDLNKYKRCICVGVGRTGYVAEIFSSFLRNLGYNSLDPNTIPYRLTSKDLILAFSGSGKSELTLEVARVGRRVGAKIVGWTSYPNSELGSLSNYIFHIKGRTKIDALNNYYERQVAGEPSTPLTPLGTLFELRLLFTLLSFIGNIVNGKEVRENYKKLSLLCKEYSPSPKEFENLYWIIPKPRSVENPLARKTVVLGEGFSGMVGKFFVTRFRHCAKENEERDVSFYTDAGSVSVGKNDLVLIISGSGREKFYNLASKVKRKGTKIGVITSFDNTNLAKIADVTTLIPGRREEKLEGLTSSYYPKEPEKSIFELRTLLALESFLYLIGKKEGITEEDMKRKHSDFT
jgi:6-phospho-3-hexuloisomerase